MHFDKLCGVCERHFPNLLDILHRAALFEFPGRAHEILPKALDPSEQDLLRESFFLPFTVTAMEDTASCTIFMDSVQDQQGWDAPRFFLDATPLDPEFAGEFQNGKEHSAATREMMASLPSSTSTAYVVTMGKIFRLRSSTDVAFDWDAAVSMQVVATKKEILVSADRCRQLNIDCHDVPWRTACRNAVVSVQEILWFNSPSRFVVETSNPKNTRKPHPSRVLRSHDRPRYTLLTPRQIYDVFGTTPYSDATEASRLPHVRRRHFRTLRSDRFVSAKGRTLCIPATWVGPEEATVGNKRYRIRLDL